MGTVTVFTFISVGLVLASCQSMPTSICDPETRFRCTDGVCLSLAKRCNGIRDCMGGGDERGCSATSSCMNRNLTLARLNYYYPTTRSPCRKQCRSNYNCRGVKKCVCDDECGMSCLNKYGGCDTPPPDIPNMNGSMVFKNTLPNRQPVQIRSAPYMYGSYVKYICPSGFDLRGPAPRCNGRKEWSGERPVCVDTLCRGERPNIPHSQYHGIERLYERDRKVGNVLEYRCDEGYTREGGEVTCGQDLQWTSFTCVVQCFKDHDPIEVRRLGLSCGEPCSTTSDCRSGEFCKCDGPCSRVCVNENMDCGEAPVISNANVTINGSLARYRCHEGYYLSSGKLSMHCLGSGNIWDNSKAPVCEPVYCGDPSVSIQETQGMMSGERYFYNYGAVVQFYCPSNYKLIGSPVRRCSGNGQWSGELAVCDLKDRNRERCPHPGRPINGKLIGGNFSIGAIVRFECDEEYIMYGHAEQECLYFRDWSGSRTPRCVYYRYPHSKNNVIGTLERTLENLPDVEYNLGKSINANDVNRKHEIYFVFDVSKSVREDEGQLDDGIKFAIRLVRRLQNFRGKIYYSVTIFASEYVTPRNISGNVLKSDEVVTLLGDILSNVKNGNYDSQTKSGTATTKALREVQNQIGFSDQNDNTRKRHVFLFTDGQHTEGGDPVQLRKDIEFAYNTTEFYSITACKKCTPLGIKELKNLASKEENFVEIEDFYLLSEYLDKVTNVTEDYSKCGMSGNQESVNNLASEIGTDKGENAQEDQWRWQVLITIRGDTITETLQNDNKILGGAAIINEDWVLTAAHVLHSKLDVHGNLNKQVYALFVGIVERPDTYDNDDRNNEVKKSVQAYEIKNYIEHPGYHRYNNDIALMQVGARLKDDIVAKYEGEGLTFGYYVRPVCLPCTGSCVKNEHLVDEDDDPLIKDTMSEEEKCRVEEKFLRDNHTMTVVTGFGHIKKEEGRYTNIKPAKRLQKGLLRIVSDEGCRNGIIDINNLRGNSPPYGYTENMLCFEPVNLNKAYDACTGDSGGAVVQRVKLPAGIGGREKDEYCWVAIGIVSFGYGCATGKVPGYYTNVAKFVQWINNTTRSNGSSR